MGPGLRVSAGDLPLVPARFVRRPNRFVVEARTERRELVECHLADPGRLIELLVPDARMMLRPVAPSSTRRTRFTVSLVSTDADPRTWVSVETTRANDLAASLLERALVDGIEKDAIVRREVALRRKRFDFVVSSSGSPDQWIEVKSATLVENGVARFPDAPTARGTGHVEELTRLVTDGYRAMLLFVVQRGDASRVEPHREIDPAFAAALEAAARGGVELRAVRFRFEATGSAEFLGELPVVP